MFRIILILVVKYIINFLIILSSAASKRPISFSAFLRDSIRVLQYLNPAFAFLHRKFERKLRKMNGTWTTDIFYDKFVRDKH